MSLLSFLRLPGKQLSAQIAKQSKELKRLREVEKTYTSEHNQLSEVTKELERRNEFETQLSGELTHHTEFATSALFRQDEAASRTARREGRGGLT